MKKLLSTFMASMLVLSVVGCSSQSSNNTTSTADATASSTTKTFTVARENDVISLNTMYATDGMSFQVIHTMVDGLMTIDLNNQLVPAIAESYVESGDGLTYIFKIREDAVWSNGTPVTAHDFEFAWKETIASPDAEYAYIFTSEGANILNADDILYGGADADTLGITALDDLTLEVRLEVKTPYFLSLMTFPVFYPVNEEFYSSQGSSYAFSPDSVLSNGAFILTAWERDTKIELVKNPTYYDADAVHLDQLVFRITPEVSTSVTAFEAGAVDYTLLSSTLVDKYIGTDEYTEVLGGYLWYLQFNLDEELYQSENLRMALAYAINKDDITQNVLKDGSLSLNGFVPYGMAPGPDGQMYRDTADDYLLPNIDLAQEYFALALEELDTDKITINLLYENADPAKSAAEYLQGTLPAYLPGLVVNVNIQPKENRIELQKSGDFEVVLTRWGPDYDDPTTYLNLMLSGNAYNYGNYSEARYDEKMAEAAAATSDEERWELLKEAEAIMMESASIIPIFQTGGAALMATNVSDLIVQTVGVPYIYKHVDID